MMLAVPLTLLVPDTRSKANVQLAPEARVDAADPAPGWGQLPLLPTVKPAVVLGFWPDAGTGNARGALPIFATVTVCALVDPIGVVGKVRALVDTFTLVAPKNTGPERYRLPALSRARRV
jgi:hypothetical protein